MPVISVEDLFRVLIGAVFVLHGAPKLVTRNEFIGYLRSVNFPLPAVSGWIAILSEFLGGLLLIAGFAEPLPQIALIGTMLGAIRIAHWTPNPIGQKGGWEYPAVLIGALTTLGWHDAIPYVTQLLAFFQ